MDKAITWYEANQQLIAESLPLTVDGVTFRQEWQERFDQETLPKYRAGRLSGVLATAYVLLTLRRVWRGCLPQKKRSKEEMKTLGID